MFSVLKKITMTALMITTVFASSTCLSKSFHVKGDEFSSISVPIILDKKDRSSHKIMRDVKLLHKENVKRLLNKMQLKSCKSNKQIYILLDILHTFLSERYGENIEKKGKMVYLFTMDRKYAANDSRLTYMVCRW